MQGWPAFVTFVEVLCALTVPGWLVARASGRRGVDAVLWAAPVTFLVTATTAYLQVLVPYPFGWPVVLLMHALLAVGLLVGRRFVPSAREAIRGAGSRGNARGRVRPVPRRALRADIATGGRLDVLTAVGVLVATSVTAWVTWLGALGDLETASQSWDALFDINAVRSVMDGGPADPFHVSTFVYGVPSTYYPSAFHSVAALVGRLLGSDAVVAANVTSVVVAGVLWPSTCLILLRALFGRRRMVLLAGAATVLGFWGMPWGPFGFGVLYATGMAAAFVPLAVAGTARVLGQTLTPRGPMSRALGLTVLGIVAVGLGHPRVLVLLGCVLIPMWVAFLAAAARRGLRARHWDLAVLVILLIVATVAVIEWVTGATYRNKTVAVSWPQYESFPQALLYGLLNKPVDTAPQYVTGALCLLGIVLALRRRGLRWLAFSYLFVMVLHALTATTSLTFFEQFARFWYHDQFRIGAMPAVLAVPLAAYPLTRLGLASERARRRHAAAERRAVAQTRVARRNARAASGRVWMPYAATTAVALVSLWVGVYGPTHYLRLYYGDAAADPRASLVSADEVAFFRKLADVVPPGERILNNPTDGSALIYAYTGKQVTMYIGGDASPARHAAELRRTLVRTRPDRHATVCAWLKQDRIGWVVNLGRTYSNNVVSTAPAPGMQVPHGFWATTPVLHEGSATLYRVTGCGHPDG